MNKYALGTIISTALLGMAKSKVGAASIRLKNENIYVMKFHEATLTFPYDISGGIIKCIESKLKENIDIAFFSKYPDKDLFNLFKPTKVVVDITDKDWWSVDEDQELEDSFEEISEQDSEEREERYDKYWNEEWEDRRDLLNSVDIEFIIHTPLDLSHLLEEDDNFDQALLLEAYTRLKKIVEDSVLYPCSVKYTEDLFDGHLRFDVTYEFYHWKNQVFYWDKNTQDWKPYSSPVPKTSKLRKR